MTRPAVAAWLLLLPLETALGGGLLVKSVMKRDVVDGSSAGRMLRGPSHVSIIEADRSTKHKIVVRRPSSLLATHMEGTGGSGNLPLLHQCYMTDDCAPGLFAVGKTKRKVSWFFNAPFELAKELISLAASIGFAFMGVSRAQNIASGW